MCNRWPFPIRMAETDQKLFPMIFTDLDGSLLDHHTYDYAPAMPVLEQLRRNGIPVIPCTSKTRAEVEQLRRDLASHDPYVVENGAGIFLPTVASGAEIETVECLDANLPRTHWLSILDQLKSAFPDEFESFTDMGIDGIMASTGLDRAAATRASRRDFSEPVAWHGAPERKADFIRALQDRGANVLQGGRFLSVGAACDKGTALERLQSEYQRQRPLQQVVSLAIGDSDNDRAMLDAADYALIIRSPVHSPPLLKRTTGMLITDATGPQGWADGVMHWLQQIGYHLEPEQKHTPA